MSHTLQTAPTLYTTATTGIRFAYRRLGHPSPVTGIPLVCHMHFRGNLDIWDPLLINTLALTREVIIFDNAGVGRSTGSIPSEFQGWADDLISFVRALEIGKFDLMGFSMGGIMVQHVALTVPEMVRRLIVAGSRPAAPIVHSSVKPGGVEIGSVPPSLKAFQRLSTSFGPEEEKESIFFSFYPPTESARKSFEDYWKRLQERKVEGEPVRLALIDRDGGAKNQVAATLLDRTQAEDQTFTDGYKGLNKLSMPVLVANGDNDLLIPTPRSWELFSKTENAKLIIYPKAGHGFIWQYAKEFGEDVNRFLDE